MFYVVIALGIANILAVAALAWYFRGVAVESTLSAAMHRAEALDTLDRIKAVEALLGMAKIEAKSRREAREAALREEAAEMNDDQQQGFSEEPEIPAWARGALPPKNPVKFGVEPEQAFLARHKTISDEG